MANIDWKMAFDAVQTALKVVAAADDIPGAKLIPHVSTIAGAAEAIQAGINTGKKVAPLVKAMVKTYSGGLPTDEERAALDARIKSLEAEVDAPLPRREEGEPE